MSDEKKPRPSTPSMEKAAQAWCEPETSHITMIPELAIVFAGYLDGLKDQFRKELTKLYKKAYTYDGMIFEIEELAKKFTP